jgi:hypothetical protein
MYYNNTPTTKEAEAIARVEKAIKGAKNPTTMTNTIMNNYWNGETGKVDKWGAKYGISFNDIYTWLIYQD